MKKNRSPRERGIPETVLRLPDLDHARAAVLNTLTCPDPQRRVQPLSIVILLDNRCDVRPQMFQLIELVGADCFPPQRHSWEIFYLDNFWNWS